MRRFHIYLVSGVLGLILLIGLPTTITLLLRREKRSQNASVENPTGTAGDPSADNNAENDGGSASTDTESNGNNDIINDGSNEEDINIVSDDNATNSTESDDDNNNTDTDGHSNSTASERPIIMRMFACPRASEEAPTVQIWENFTDIAVMGMIPHPNLCMLWQVQTSKTNAYRAPTRIPVGRSYNNHDWEVYSNSMSEHVAWECEDVVDDNRAGRIGSNGSTTHQRTCYAPLPPSPKDDSVSISYEMVSIIYDSLSPRNQIARFLEQTSFGPTSTSIAEIMDGGTDALASKFPEYLMQQMYATSPSFHRTFFRQRLNHRKYLSTPDSIPTHACQQGTRYRKYAFSDKDRQKAQVVIITRNNQKYMYANFGNANTMDSTEVLEISLRTIVPHQSIFVGTRDNNANTVGAEVQDGSYLICASNANTIGGRWTVAIRPGQCLPLVTSDGNDIGVPSVIYDSVHGDARPLLQLSGEVAKPINEVLYPPSDPVQEIILTEALTDVQCTNGAIPEITSVPHVEVVAFYENEFYIHDPRWSLNGGANNTLESPNSGARIATLIEEYRAEIRGALRTLCANVPINFVNEAQCVMEDNVNSVCTPTDEIVSQDENGLVTASITLNANTFAAIYEVTQRTRTIYSVEGLRQGEYAGPESTPPPCTASTTSRWRTIPDAIECDVGSAGPTTIETFRQLIRAARNKLDDATGINTQGIVVVDVFSPAIGAYCDDGDADKHDFQLIVGGQCWQNIHPDDFQVFDFTSWVTNHPGGPAPIRAFSQQQQGAEEATFRILYPDWHAMSRWHIDGKNDRVSLGRLGETVPLRLSREIAEFLGADIIEEGNDGDLFAIPSRSMLCGSPNEVSNEFSLGGSFGLGAFDAATIRGRTSNNKLLLYQKMNVWMGVVLNAPDQFRQRVAWALAQLLVITPSAVVATSRHMTETFLSFYDIFVRHAFGKYRDILKEVTYAPLMGEMLSYVGSRSTQHIWQTERRLEYADENFAREVMQLFSIGLFKLHNNGTRIIDARTDQPIRTYNNDEISEYARIYTGFEPRKRRGNIEDRFINDGMSAIDPMKLNLDTHDRLPKLGLNGRYVGDDLPLCTDLPAQHFLKAGSVYRLLGTNSSPRSLKEPLSWSSESAARTAISRLTLDPTSPLYRALCNSSGEDGRCNFRGRVRLGQDLSCGDRSSALCMLQSPRVVEVGEGIFYEYARPPCSRLSFFQEGRVMTTRQSNYCEDPELGEGITACCAGDDSSTPDDLIKTFDIFSGERVDFVEALEKCERHGLGVCSSLPTDCRATNSCDDSIGHWTAASCSIKVKIGIEGRVAIVHSLPDQIPETNVDVNIRDDTKSFFRVQWNPPQQDWQLSIASFIANYDASCAVLGCERDSSDNLCVCSTRRIDKQAIESMPSVHEVLQLRIGAFDPRSRNDLAKTDFGNGVVMYSMDDNISQESIFEVVDDNGVTHWQRNVVSSVNVGDEGTLGTLSFRNAPHMVSITHPELRDVEYEIDEALDHYLYHQNTAPFLALRMAQRFGLSNPSPRYIDVMASAFRAGKYVDVSTGNSFGSGSYGDMGALIAASILDRESRSSVLDKDPSHGSLFEPFARLLRLMRSLEFEANNDSPFVYLSEDLQSLLGQEPYQMPSVFSFFLPEYRSQDGLGKAGLACPECQALTGPKVVSLMNGMLGYLKYGLDSAYGGLARGNANAAQERRRQVGNYRFAMGQSNYDIRNGGANAEQVVRELSSLLTSGRLSAAKLTILQNIYEESLGQSESISIASINVQQAIISSPEYHTNSISENNLGSRPKPEASPPSNNEYKAVIFLMLEGGYDSYNMLVPHECAGDLAEQYVNERGSIGLNDEERQLLIDAQSSNQPCNTFALHPELTVVKELYDGGNLTFFANTGVLGSAKMDKSSYFQYTPIQLFAHNSMQRETKTVDVFEDSAGTGVLGRLADVLSTRGYNTNSITIDSPSVSVAGGSDDAPAPIIVSRLGAETFSRQPESERYTVKEHATQLNSKSSTYSSLFGETWSHSFLNGVDEAEAIKAQLDSATLGNHWPETLDDASQGLGVISKLIETRDARGTDRDVFYTSVGGWDHHRRLKENLRVKFSELNGALDLFVKELKRQDRFDDVTIVVASEFARTITPNSGGGSDHAWGGTYFMIGGEVKGGRIEGVYPDNITPTGPLNLGRGRILPTTSWDCIWNSVCQWMGVEGEDDLDVCLPNRANVAGLDDDGFTKLFTLDDLFKFN